MDTRTQTQTRPLFTQTGHKEHEIVMPEPKQEYFKFQCKAPLCPYGTNSAMMMGSHHKANPTHRTTEQQERFDYAKKNKAKIKAAANRKKVKAAKARAAKKANGTPAAPKPSSGEKTTLVSGQVRRTKPLGNRAQVIEGAPLDSSEQPYLHPFSFCPSCGKTTHSAFSYCGFCGMNMEGLFQDV